MFLTESARPARLFRKVSITYSFRSTTVCSDRRLGAESVVAHSGQSSQLLVDAPAEMLGIFQQLREVLMGPENCAVGFYLITRRKDL